MTSYSETVKRNIQTKVDRMETVIVFPALDSSIENSDETTTNPAAYSSQSRLVLEFIRSGTDVLLKTYP